MKKIILTAMSIINKFLYPTYNLKQCPHSSLLIFKIGLFQKILGINRHVPWPVHRSSFIKSPEKIKIGTRTPGLSVRCYLDGRNGINFGKNVWIGPGVSIISMNHDLNDYYQFKTAKKIIISDNCWLAANVIILPSVELGPHTVVAAGAVVTKSFPVGDQLIAGNPAKVVKKLPAYKDTNE